MAIDTARNPPRPRVILVAALLGLFMTLLDVTVVNVALPTIKTDTNASFTDLEWIANAYLLTLGVFIVTAGRLGDVFGLRPVYLTGVFIFLLGSVVCGAAGSASVFGWPQITVLHVGRAVQGLGGSIIVPLTLAIIYNSFDGRPRALGMMLWGAVGGLATALGPLIGGVLVTHAGWEWVFFINVPLGVVVLCSTVAGVYRRAPSASAHNLLDVGGLITISVALLCLNLAIINGNEWGWASEPILLLFAGAIIASAIFVAVESRVDNPILDLTWFRTPNLSGALLAGLLLGTGLFAIVFYLSLYLQNGLSLSAEATGVRLLPLTAMLLIGAPIGGRMRTRIGVRRTLAIALTIMATGILFLGMTDSSGDPDAWIQLLPGMLLTGLTMGIVIPIVAELTVDSAPKDRVGVASSLGTMMRQVGNATGVAIIGALLTSNPDKAAKSGSAAIAQATQHGAWFAGAVTIAAAAVVCVLVRSPSARIGRHRRVTRRKLPAHLRRPQSVSLEMIGSSSP